MITAPAEAGRNISTACLNKPPPPFLDAIESPKGREKALEYYPYTGSERQEERGYLFRRNAESRRVGVMWFALARPGCGFSEYYILFSYTSDESFLAENNFWFPQGKAVSAGANYVAP